MTVRTGLIVSTVALATVIAAGWTAAIIAVSILDSDADA